MKQLRLLNAALVVVLAAGVAGTWALVRSGDDAQAVSARTATVTTGSITATVTGSGNLASGRTASLAFGASGTVRSLDVGVGDRVKVGDTLATIDTAAAEQDLSAANAQLTSAEASYDDAVDNAASSSDSNSDAGLADAIDAAQISLKAAQQQVLSAQQQLADDTRTQDRTVAEAKAAVKSGKGTQSQVDAATAGRNQALARDRHGILTAQAGVATAKGNLAKAKAGDSSSAGGSSSGSSSSASSSSSGTAQIASAEVTVEQAKSAVQDAEDALADTTIKAPFSGTVTAVNGSVGDSVSSGASGSSGSSSSGSSSSSSSSGSSGSSATAAGGTSSTGSSSTSSSSAFITIATLSTMKVTANIAEADIGSVKSGQDATVTLSADDTETTGTVSTVAPEGTTSSNVVQYPVTVTVDDPPATARIGASVSVVITTGSADDALVLPIAAITTTGTRHTVTLMKNGVATPTQVQTGLAGSTTTQITSGLAAGDVVRLPTTTTSTSTGVPGFGGGAGLGRSLGGGAR